MKLVRTTKIIQAGMPGSKKFNRIYGDDLICIRYKYDYKNKQRMKTIELIVDKKMCEPGNDDLFLKKKVKIKIRREELSKRQSVKKEGGKWDVKNLVWILSLKSVLKLKLENRIVK